jgi:peptidoglycan/LPS O-acetylase OafA/YrhL
MRKRLLLGSIVVLIFLMFRYFEYRIGADIQFRAYYTLLGRFDQFICGILAQRFSYMIPKARIFGITVCLLFLTYFYIFDLIGGYYGPFNYGQHSWLWIFQLDVEAIFWALLIVWYDSQRTSDHFLSRFIANIGQWSYSIYLLHSFIIFDFSSASWIDGHVMDISNPYMKLIAAFVTFLFFLPLAKLSYNFIELPFLRFRKPYLY